MCVLDKFSSGAKPIQTVSFVPFIVHSLERGRHGIICESHVKGSDNTSSKAQENLRPLSPCALLRIWLQVSPPTLEGILMPVLLVERYFQSLKLSHYRLLAEFPVQSAQALISPKYTSSQGQISLDRPATPLRWAVANKLGRKESPFLPHYLHYICHNPQKRSAWTCSASSHSPVQSWRSTRTRKTIYIPPLLYPTYSTEPHNRQMKKSGRGSSSLSYIIAVNSLFPHSLQV